MQTGQDWKRLFGQGATMRLGACIPCKTFTTQSSVKRETSLFGQAQQKKSNRAGEDGRSEEREKGRERRWNAFIIAAAAYIRTNCETIIPGSTLAVPFREIVSSFNVISGLAGRWQSEQREKGLETRSKVY